MPIAEGECDPMTREPKGCFVPTSDEAFAFGPADRTQEHAAAARYINVIGRLPGFSGLWV
jgi:hypothetical protein